MIRLPRVERVPHPALRVPHRRDLVDHRHHVRRRAAVERAGERADRGRQRRAAVRARRGRDARGERGRVEAVLGRADPVRVDRLHVRADPPRRATGGGTSPRRSCPAATTSSGTESVFPSATRAERATIAHHLRRQPPEVVAGLLVGDLVELAEAPVRPRGGRSRPAGRPVRYPSGGRLVRLRLRHHRARGRRRRGAPRRCSYGYRPTSSSMSTPRYRSEPPSRSGSAISVSTATTPSSPGLKSATSLIRREDAT